jgi:hypothetical protein
VYKNKEFWTMANILVPLVKNVSQFPRKKDSLRPSFVLLKDRLEKSARRMKELREDSKSPNTTEIQVLRKTFVYLALFETSITNIIDLIILLLIVNGHDFYIYDMRKYSKNLRDLDRATLYEKLVFLDAHGLEVISTNVNKSLRNKIAHFDFEIAKDGIIIIDNGKYNLEEEILKIMALVLALTRVFEDAGFPELFNQIVPSQPKEKGIKVS